jgi:ERCC4 domain
VEIILKVDNRERSIHEHLNAAFSTPPLFCAELSAPEFAQLDIGDFIIMAEKENATQILAVIERKTLADYAASLKDGRIINTEKLIKLREETGCQVYYLIEGSIGVSHETQICGIEYYKILANIRDAQILHGINVLNTANKLKTAEELKFLVERYIVSYTQISGRIKITGAFDEIMEKCKPTEEQTLIKDIGVIWTNLLSNAVIKTKVTPSVKAFKLGSTYTLLQWVMGEISETELSEIRINNRRLEAKHIESISKPMNPQTQLKALTCIKGISADFAVGILKVTNIAEIISEPRVVKLTVIGNRKLGVAVRKKIVSIFTHRIVLAEQVR